MDKLKDTALKIIVLIIIVSAGMNVFKQYSTLVDAKRRNNELEIKIFDLMTANRILERKIEYATSSAYIEQQARDKFGLGRENDFWIEATEKEMKELYQEAKVEEKVPILKQWIDLFTR